MTPENKKILKVIAVAVGVVLVVTVATILIVRKIEKDKAAKQEADAAAENSDGSVSPSSNTLAAPTTSGAQSTSSFQGRVFTKIEVEKMQSLLMTLGAIWSRPDIVAAIRDTGGVDGRIGTGFKTAYDLAIQYHLITDLDQLYNEATK